MPHALHFVLSSWAFGPEHHEELANPFISLFVKCRSFFLEHRGPQNRYIQSICSIAGAKNIKKLKEEGFGRKS